MADLPARSASRCAARWWAACRASPSRRLSLRLRRSGRGRGGYRHRLHRRHQCPLGRLCGQAWLRGFQPGAGRPRRGQPGRRGVPGLPDQQQWLADPGRRGQRREDPADRRCGGAIACCCSSRRLCSATCPCRARGGRDRLGDRPVRVQRPRRSIASSAGSSGYRIVGFLGGAHPRADAGNVVRDRHRPGPSSSGIHWRPYRHPGESRGRAGLPRHDAVSGCGVWSRGWCSFAGTRPSSSPTPRGSARLSSTSASPSPAGPLAGRRGRAGDQH